MKISFISTFYPYRGGIAHFNALLFNELRARSHKLEAINFIRQYPKLLFPGKSQEEQDKTYNDVYDINAKRVLDSINPFSWIKTALKVRASNPEIILFRYWISFFAPAYFVISFIATLFRKTKVIYIVDNFHPHEKRPGNKVLLWLATRRVDGYMTMSSTVESDLKHYLPNAVLKKAPHPVYNIFGKPVSKEEARKKLDLTQDANVVLFFGYIRDYKGLDILLKAIPSIVDERPNTMFVIAGEFYSNEKTYTELISSLNLEPYLMMHTSYIPNQEVAKFFCAADCVLLPYKQATQSGIVQIAYHFNKPVIATEVGGLSEMIIHGKTGYLVKGCTPEAISESVVKFFTAFDPMACRTEIENEKKKYSWSHFSETLEELFDELTR